MFLTCLDENIDTKVICKNQILYLITDYYDNNNIFDISNIEKKTNFNTKITVNTNINTFDYDIYCRLWKPKNRNLIIICQKNDTLYNEKENIVQGYFNEVVFNYEDYKVIITPNIILSLQMKDIICPFLYANEQVINIVENEDNYKLNFKSLIKCQNILNIIKMIPIWQI